MTTAVQKKIWIDLENSPHVPFFKPIIEELSRKGFTFFITARDCSQTCGLADLLHVPYVRIGRHYGKNKIMKTAGLGIRVLQLLPLIKREKPDLALAHGSRTQLMLASLMGITSIAIMDYEHATPVPFSEPDWLIVPEVISQVPLHMDSSHILKYPGIKEDVYVPSFTPDDSIKKELQIDERDLLVTIRPPATDAHYFVPQSEELFEATVDFLARKDRLRMIVLPRNEKQAAFVRSLWPQWIGDSRIIIPDRVINGLNLLWHSDFVISGGGTMNREAAALGVPVYSIFRGAIGAVDRYLSETGRLKLLESVEEVRTRIPLVRRVRPKRPDHLNTAALKTVVGLISSIAASGRIEPAAAALGEPARRRSS